MRELSNMKSYYDEHPSLWNFLYPFFGQASQEGAQSRVTEFIQKERTFQKGKNALYLHIPFCDTICSFCPFIKSTKYEPIIGKYIDALINEMRILSQSPNIQKMTFDVVFVGGGTPSIMPPELIYRLSTAIKENFSLSADYEWTFECEAKTATPERVAAMAEGGANRGSFGVQTLNEHYRKMFNLTASFDQISQTVDLMKRHFQSYNIDLLYQLPGQTKEEMLEDINGVMALGSTSIDTYPLEYIACSKGWLSKINKGKVPMPPNPKEKFEFSDTLYRHLKTNGWHQNYVYTFMAPEHQNKRFQYGEVIYGGYEDQYIGLGTGAISYMQGMIWSNEGNTQKYIESLTNQELPIVKSREYHAFDRRLVFFPKTMKIEKTYLNRMPKREEIYRKLQLLIMKGVVEEAEQYFVIKEEAKPWYPAILVDLIPEKERENYDQAVEFMQKELGWYESTEVLL
ncbi:Oxygen-independent coproporphyrinogen-III oxidase-like protein [Bacillus safensis]|uniref:Heme chaperone HemW n=3 Tax=Bacillaceae TaxID=186817 RepID=A0A5C0WM39_BACIA|nr:Oxygen-independent coproporphyrinogen-III oxidase-like protein [Bacillus safensis]